MKAYNDFRDAFLKNIKNKDKSLFIQNSEDCYLIEEFWIDELLKSFKKNNNLNSIPQNEPTFINNFKSIIECLIIEQNLKIINKKFVENFFSNKDYLKNKSIIKYYGGNNKIIIEYKDNKDDKALFVIDPLDKNSIKERTFILSIHNVDKFNLFKSILSEENNSNILLEEQNKKYIMSLNNYLNYTSNQKVSISPNEINSGNNNKNDIDENAKKEIIKIFINIFYYLKYLNDEKEKIYNENNNSFYLVNIEWFNNFLEHYDYQKIYRSLINSSKKNPQINYANLNKYTNNIIEIYYKKKLINFGKKNNEDLLDIQKIFVKMNKTNNIFSFNNCYIIPTTIFYLINKCILQNKVLQHYRKKIYLKDKDIYFIDLYSIIIGNLHKEYFIPKYILFYNTQNLLNTEKEIFDSNEIEDYIKSRNCEINDDYIQNLIYEKKIIGKFITLMNPKIDKYRSNKQISESKIKNMNGENANMLINKCKLIPRKKIYLMITKLKRKIK